MSSEQDPRKFDKPIAVLKKDELILTGSAALIGYTLLCASRNYEFVPMSELVAVQIDERENSHKAYSRAYYNIERVASFFRECGMEIEKKRFVTGRQGGQIGYRLERLQNTIAFAVEDGNEFKNVQGPKPINSLCQHVIRKEPGSKKDPKPESEILLAEGVPAPVTLAPSLENTQVFFGALSFPIDNNNPPKPFRIQSEREVRDWKILGRHLGTDAVLAETGKHHGITGAGGRVIEEKLVNQSYNAAPAVLKEHFPREILATKKPYTLHKGMRNSEARGGKMRQVQEAALAGKTLAYIQDEMKVSTVVLRRYRSKGIAIPAVPYLNEAQGKEYQENLHFLADGLLDDRQIIGIFDDIEKHNRRKICYGLKKAGVLVPMTKAARNERVFIHKRQSVAYRLLKELEIPVIRVESSFTDKSGKQEKKSYFFVLNNHEETKETFAHPSFDAFRTNPVRVFGKVPDKIPTTNIMWDDAYIRMGKFLKERGILISIQQARKYLGSDCPAVFHIRYKDKKRSGTGLFVRDEDANALEGYLRAKLAS